MAFSNQRLKLLLSFLTDTSQLLKLLKEAIIVFLSVLPDKTDFCTLAYGFMYVVSVQAELMERPISVMLRKALTLLSGNATSSLLLLLRNLIVARLIPVSDYGVAATFAIVMAGVEMASALGLHQQIVQAKNGNDPRFQAVLQAFQVMRGVVAGAVLFFLAVPLAAFFGIPEVAWAYQVLALIPVLKSLEHFDIHRLNREMRFGPLILSRLIPAAISLALIWPLAWILGDWQVMLYSIMVHTILVFVVSHLLAERRYALIWDHSIMLGSLRFGWPILVNSGLMFLVFQGDKMIVGRILGLEALAIFALGLTLTLTPTLVVAKTAQNLFLPRLSQLVAKQKQDSTEFTRLIYATFCVHFIGGIALVAAVILFGNLLIDFALGPDYADLKVLLFPMAVLQALRVFKGGASISALAFGVTTNPMIANMVRGFLLPVGVWVAIHTEALIAVLAAAIFAELLAFVVSFILFLHLVTIDLRPLVISLVGSLLLLMLAASVFFWAPSQNFLLGVIINAGLILLVYYNRPWLFKAYKR